MPNPSDHSRIIDEATLRASFEYSLNGIVEVAADGRVLHCNPAASSILGLPRRRIAGAFLDEVLAPGEQFRERWQRHLATVGEQGMGLVTLEIGGLDPPQVIEVASVDIGDGRKLHILDDITEQRNLTDSLEAARRAADQASAAKSAFLANMSHEIRTPLNGIIGIERLLRLTELTAQQAGYLDDLRRASQTLLALLGDVLDLSKIEADRFELECRPFDTGELLDTVAASCRPAAAGKPLRMLFDVDPALPRRLQGDPLRLAQAVNNLLANAIKFTPAGQVVLAVSWAAQGEGRGRLRLAVRDTGIGMSPEQLERVFTPFVQADPSVTRRFGGTGLGLAIARGMVERMGGTLAATSRPGAGSEFVIEVAMEALAAAGPHGGAGHGEIAILPDEPLFAPAGGSADEGLRGEFSGATAMVVEDDAINRRVIAGLLRFAGIEVTVAENGQVACAALLAPGAPAVQLILMDVHMPVLDGISAARALRAAGLATPIVALTADVSAGAREACLAAGMNDWLSKPPGLDDLEGVLTRWLPVRGAPGGGASPEPPVAAGLDYVLPGIDIAGAMERFIGNRTLFEQAVVSFVRVRGPEIARIAELAGQDERAPLERLLHNLAGSSGMLGADAVYAAVRSLEKALARDPPQDLHGGVQRLREAFDEVAAGVNRRFP